MHSDSPTDPPRCFRQVLVATRIFTPDPGAAAQVWKMWAKSLAHHAEAVEVLTTQSISRKPARLPRNIRVRRWPVLRDRDGAVRGYIPYLSFDIPLFFRLLFARRPSVVLCEPPPTTGAVTRVACALRRVPYVYRAADILSDAAQANGMKGPLLRLLTRLERFALGGAQEVIAVSDAVAQRVEDLTGNAPTVIRHAVELTPIKHGQNALAASLPDSEPLFLYSGTVADWMGVDVFVEAAPLVLEHFPSGRFVFMGQGTGWDSLVDQIDELADPRVSWLDPCPPAEARQWESAATVTMAALRPGLYDFAYTTKVLTSLASGTPVVYLGVGPAAEEIERDQLGTVCEHDPVAAADALVTTATAVLEGDRAFASERLAAWVEQNHGAEASGEKLLQVLRRAVESYYRTHGSGGSKP